MPRGPNAHNKTSISPVSKSNAHLPVVNTNKIDIQRPSFSQTMKEGFGLGVGMSVAQHAVNGIINSISPKSQSIDPNTQKYIEYEKCLKYSSNNTDLCKPLLD